jgi:hypothetical protein
MLDRARALLRHAGRPDFPGTAMKSRPPSSLLLANPLMLWGTLALKTIQTQAAAAQVIALRTTRMAVAGANPNASDRREMKKMGAEKMDAFSRAGAAIATGAMPLVAGMAGQAFRSGMEVFAAATRLAASRSLPQTMQRQRLLTDTLMRHAPSAHHGATAAARLAHRALAPVHSTATANARRLKKAR